MLFKKDPPGFYIETIKKEYTETDPVLFDTSEFDWCARLESVTPQLVKELAPVLSDGFAGLKTNPEERFQFPPKIWKGYPFYFNGFKIKKHLKDYPFVTEELAKIPNMVSASVSVLEPGAQLLPHNGNSNGVMRYHLGLNIPAPMPECGFIIGGHELSWEVGKSFMFCNMNVHSAHNKTNKRRHILMLDVVRPEFVSIKKKICVHTIARILTNSTADFFRRVFGVTKSMVVSNLNKEFKNEKGEPAMDARKITPAMRIMGLGEPLVLQFYIAALSIIFFFKKMQ